MRLRQHTTTTASASRAPMVWPRGRVGLGWLGWAGWAGGRAGWWSWSWSWSRWSRWVGVSCLLWCWAAAANGSARALCPSPPQLGESKCNQAQVQVQERKILSRPGRCGCSLPRPRHACIHSASIVQSGARQATPWLSACACACLHLHLHLRGHQRDRHMHLRKWMPIPKHLGRVWQ